MEPSSPLPMGPLGLQELLEHQTNSGESTTPNNSPPPILLFSPHKTLLRQSPTHPDHQLPSPVHPNHTRSPLWTPPCPLVVGVWFLWSGWSLWVVLRIWGDWGRVGFNWNLRTRPLWDFFSPYSFPSFSWPLPCLVNQKKQVCYTNGKQRNLVS